MFNTFNSDAVTIQPRRFVTYPCVINFYLSNEKVQHWGCKNSSQYLEVIDLLSVAHKLTILNGGLDVLVTQL